MKKPNHQATLDLLLDSWDRNNTILVNLLRVIQQPSLGARSAEDSPSIAELFMHIHYVRLVLVSEDAPEFATEIRFQEWIKENDPERMAAMLNQSAEVVRQAVNARIKESRAMDRHYDHPLLFIQHMIWHEGYHHGQIKLALKLSGHALADKEAGPLTWSIWTRKSTGGGK